MNIIIVRGRAIDPAVHKVCTSLSKNGYNVRLLLWDRQNTYPYSKNNEYIVDKCLIKSPYDEFTSIFYYPFWIFYQFIYLIKNNTDIIHANDLDTLIPAILIKLIKIKKLCYTIYDFYADNLPAKTPNIFRNLISIIEKIGISQTDALFLVSEERYKQIEGSKIKILNYIYNTPEDTYTQNNNLSQNTKENAEFSIFYAGTLIEDRGILNLIKTIEEIDNIKLIIAGIGPLTNYLKNISVSQKGKMQYLSWLSYNEVIGYTRNADLLFAFYDPKIPNNRYASPNKLFEAMMCRKPILVNDGTTMADIVRKENCGLVVPYGDVEAIKHAILTLKDNPELCTQLGKNGRSAYEEKYSWKIMEKRLLTAYSQFA